MTDQETKQPQHPGYYPEDEIDLVDLVAVLYRRKWLILVTTIIIALLALGYTFLQPKKYEASTMVEIGQLYTEEGYQRVESALAVKNRIESLAQANFLKMKGKMEQNKEKNPDLGFSVKDGLTIDAPDKGNIVSLSLETLKTPKAIEFLSKTNEDFIQDHNRIFGQERERLKNLKQKKNIRISNIERRIIKTKREYKTKEMDIKSNIEKINIKMTNYKNDISHLKRTFAQDEEQIKNKIKEMKNKIQSINSQKDVIKGQLSLLKIEKENLQERIKSAQKRYQTLLDSKLAANAQATASEGIGLMLFSNEIQNVQNYLDNLRERSLLKIPQQRNELRNQLYDLDVQIHNLQTEIGFQEKQLSQLDPELQDKIAEIQGRQEELKLQRKKLEHELAQLDEELQDKIQNLKEEKEQTQLEIHGLETKLNNMITTQAIVAPRFSENAVSPNLKLNTALGLVVGLFFSVVLAFIVEFWRKNRNRIVEKQE